MKAWRGLLAMTALLAASNALADQFAEARVWLERMSASMREQSYQGTFVYVRGDDVETIRLTHVLENGAIRERLVALSGPPREVVRDGRGLRAVGERGDATSPPAQLVGVPIPDFSAASLERAQARYMFEMGGEGRIAGYQGRKLTITPRDQYRYGYELWLEDRTALLLRWVLYDPDRRPLAKLMFTELVTGDAVDHTALGEEADQPAATGGTPQAAPVRAAASPEAFPVDELTLPPGFALAAQGRDPANPESEHLVFSDGLASVSVYLEPSAAETGLPEGLSRVGTTNAWSRRGEDRRVTVVGEVPPVTLKTIGRAFLRLDVAE